MGLSLYAGEGEREFIDLTESFARKAVLPMFGGDSADGDLGKVPSLLDKAFEIGLAASPDRQMPGYEYGIWGSSIRESGMRLSVNMLSVVAEVCGGVAMNLHSQGLASLIISLSGKEVPEPPKRAALALQEGYGPPGYGTLLDPGADAPAQIMTQARPSGQGYTISGEKSFVYALKGVESFVVACRVGNEKDHGWGLFLVPASSKGASIRSVSGRTGLRACDVLRIGFENVEVPGPARIDEGNGAGLVNKALCINWLGISAIAAGIAKGAVRAAREYASTRYQGGAMIENHPAIQKLIALSEARMETAHAHLNQVASLSLEGKGLLPRCAIAKLMVTDLCFHAVTDSLQVFGGYGYMEDYGMEKRLRDAAVLKSVSGSPNSLELFIFEAGKEVSA